MSIRDNKRKHNHKNETNVELANLQAMVEHNTEIHNNPLVTNESTTMNTNNEAVNAAPVQSVQVVSESDVNSELSAAIQTNPAPETMSEIMDNVDTPIYTDVASETERNTVLITEWIYSLTPPTPDNALAGLNLHTVTGLELVQAYNLPAFIPLDVTAAIMTECAKYPVLNDAMPYASILVGTSRTDEGTDVAALLTTGLSFAKPYIVNKVIPNIDKVYNFIMAFIKAPVEAVAGVEQVVVEPTPVAPVPAVKTVTTSVANENKTINVAVTITEGTTTETNKAEVVAEVPVVKDPEALLAEWALANPGYSFDQYFGKRNELYINAA